MRDNITRGNMDDEMAAKWFPFIGALFLFIWFSNLIGYIPLPTNTEHKFDVFGVEVPAFALYAATANLSVPLVLALVVWVCLQRRGHPGQGLRRLPQEPGPAGRDRRRWPASIFVARAHLELHAAHLALRSSLRQHPRRPPDHPVHGRRLAVLLGIAALGWLTLPARRSRSSSSRSGLVADAAGVHLRHPHRHLPRRRRRRDH